jgi:hypothetical protein
LEACCIFSNSAMASWPRSSNWSAAYTGPHQSVWGHVWRLLEAASPDEQRRAAQRLTELVCEFIRTQGKA